MPPSTGSLSPGFAAASGKIRKSLTMSEAENGYIINTHGGFPTRYDSFIASDLDAVHEIIKTYFTDVTHE